MTRADIAVIGGGIAGAASCVALLQRGVRPVWIAPAPTPGRDRIGETLSPAANTILADLGLARLLARPMHRAANTSFSAWGSDQLVERNAIVHLEGPGTVLDRAGFATGLDLDKLIKISAWLRDTALKHPIESALLRAGNFPPA